MKRFCSYLLITALLLFSFGCGTQPAPQPATPSPIAVTEDDPAGGALPTVTLTDMLGRSVFVHGVPERIVSLCPTVTEILFALNAGDLLVGADDNSDYPAEVMTLPKMGGADMPDVDAIIAAAPDVVFVGNGTSDETLTALESAELSVVYAEAVTYEEIYASIALIAQITGTDAAELIAAMQSATAEVERMASDLEPQGVFYISAIDDAGIHTAAATSYIAALVNMAGGTLFTADDETLSPVFTMPELVSLNPQVLLVSSTVDTAALLSDPALSAAAAVTQGRVYTIEAELISRPGPRIAEALKQIYEGLALSLNS